VKPPPLGLPRVFVAVMAIALLPLLAIFVLWLASRPAQAHDPYTKWLDRRGFSCCDQRDCAPVRADLTPTGWRVWMNGRWEPVPSDAVLDIPSPDGRSHACVASAMGFFRIRCFVAGEPRS